MHDIAATPALFALAQFRRGIRVEFWCSATTLSDTCFVRIALDAGNRAVAETRNCGVRMVEGRHRTYVIDFVRDARAGGCAVGTPPANFGFRLVLED